MQVTPAALDSIFVGFNTLYQAGFSSAQPLASAVAMSVPSNSHSNVYAWMEKLLRMREWIGDRQIQNITSRTYTLENKPFELTVGVTRPEIVDDQLGIYSPLFKAMGEQTGLWMDDLLVKAIQDADDSVLGLTWDGVPFFSTVHPIDLDARETSGTQSNKLTAADLDATTVDAARVALATMKGSDNRVLGCRMTHVVVPPQLETKARKVLSAERDQYGATNVLNNAAAVLVLPQLANEATTWYAMDLSRPIKPFVAQIREAPDFVARTAPDSDPQFKRDRYEFGSKARGAAGFGLYFTAISNKPA